MSEKQQWKRIAIYLASCHANNVSIAELKSCSKYQKKRLKSIMKTAADFLNGDLSTYPINDEDLEKELERVVNQLQKNIKDVG